MSEKYCDLEILVKSQSRSLKVVPFDRLVIVFYYCFTVTLSLRDVQFQNAVTLKTGLGVRRGH